MKKKLIYNYQPRLLALDDYFVQVYIFDESKLAQKEREVENSMNRANTNAKVMFDWSIKYEFIEPIKFSFSLFSIR